LAEVTQNTKTGARGLILPASTALGNAAEETLLPGAIAELQRLGIGPREIAVDGAFKAAATNTAFAELAPQTVFISGRQEPGSKRTTRRLRRYRTRQEGRISHLKRRYGLDPSRLKGNEGRQIWTEWAIRLQHPHPRHPDPVKHSQPLLRQEQTHHIRTAAHQPPRGRFVDQELFRGK
jgi:IS5 family transposase